MSEEFKVGDRVRQFYIETQSWWWDCHEVYEAAEDSGEGT